MIIDHARQCPAALEVDDARRRNGERHDVFVASDRAKDAVFDRDCVGNRVRSVKRREATAMQNKIG
jgi:hypothetical protein